MTQKINGNHLYLSLYQKIVMQISVGRLKRGDRLPSQGELSQRYHLSVNTVRHALELLAREGLILVEQGRPATVIADSPWTAAAQEIHKHTDELKRICYDLAILFPPVFYQGAKLCDEAVLEELESTVHSYSTSLELEVRLEMVMEFFTLLLTPLNNSCALHLKDDFDHLLWAYFLSDDSLLKERYQSQMPSPASLEYLFALIRRGEFDTLLNQLEEFHFLSNPPLNALSENNMDLHQLNQLFRLSTVDYRQNLYTTVARTLVLQIDQGIYKNGDKLPSLTALQEQYGISDITARNVISFLCELGLAKTVRRKGTIVNLETPYLEALPLESPRIRNNLLNYIQSLQILSLTIEAICLDTVSLITPQVVKEYQIQLENDTWDPLFHIYLLTECVVKNSGRPAVKGVFELLREMLLWGNLLRGYRPELISTPKFRQIILDTVTSLKTGEYRKFARQMRDLYGTFYYYEHQKLQNSGLDIGLLPAPLD